MLLLCLWCVLVADQADLQTFQNDVQSATKIFNDRFMEVTKHRLTAKKVAGPLCTKFHDLLEALSQGGDVDKGSIVHQAVETLQQLVRVFTAPPRKQSRKARRKRKSKKKAAELLQGEGGEGEVMGKPQHDLTTKLVSLEDEHKTLQAKAEQLLKHFLHRGDPAVDFQSVAELRRSWNQYMLVSRGMDFRRGIIEGACAFLVATRESADRLWQSVQQGVWLARACGDTSQPGVRSCDLLCVVCV